MDFNRIIQMVINQVLRRAVNGGVDAAIRHVSRQAGPASAADEDQSRAGREATKRAREAARLTRKL